MIQLATVMYLASILIYAGADLTETNIKQMN